MDEVVNKSQQLQEQLREDGVRYAMGSYVDLLGVPKSKVVTIDSFADMAKGSELYTVGALEGMGPLGPEEDECVAVPDLSSLVKLPWNRKYAWLASDLRLNGKPYAYCTRSILRNVTEQAKEQGYRLNLGFEPELYVLTYRGDHLGPLSYNDNRATTPGYDVEATLDSADFIEPMVEYMNTIGWNVTSFDHEGGHGQFEFDFDFTDALTQADRFVFFRFMAKEVAKKLGAFATFMPKPYDADFGSGAHFNMSIGDIETGENLFADSKNSNTQGFSELAHYFAGGVMRHAKAITAVSCPTVNSYKRLTPKGHMASITWAPVNVAYGENNRSAMLRLPMNRYCVENRAVDMTANVYLAAALHFAAGLQGIREKIDPGPPVRENLYKKSKEELLESGVERLPLTLGEAIEALEVDPLVEEVFGPKLKTEFVDYKKAEWEEHISTVSDWERERYLNLF